MIPRYLFQTYPTRELPQRLSSAVATNLLNAQGWQYQCYSDDDIVDFIREHYGQRMLRRYSAISADYGAARADLFRYLLIYARGGLYLDIKAVVTRPLSEVVTPQDSFLLGQWRDCGEDECRDWGQYPSLKRYGGEFQQWFVAASPRHPFLEAVIGRVCRNIDYYFPALHGTGKPGVLQVTGPIAYTKAIGPMLHRAPHRRVRSHTDLGLVYSAFGNAEQHFSLFPKHYSTLRTPLVRIGPARTLLSGMTNTAREVLRPLVRR